MQQKAEAKSKIEALIAEYLRLGAADELEIQSEANVRANFIDPLFEALGWPIHNSQLYNREEYVRGAGFADIALKAALEDAAPLIFVEAKRFGVIKKLTRIQQDRDYKSAAFKLPDMSVDRTREEQQAINYAWQKGIQWAVLTDFRTLRLFNARRDTLVISFDDLNDYRERFDELWQLSFERVKQGSLTALRAHRQRAAIDEEYLRLINVWRLRLGQDIVAQRENRPFLTHPDGTIDVYKLREAVQRILDRLVVVRYAEDRFVVEPDILYKMVQGQESVSIYAMPLLDQMRYFFEQFNVHHNGSLFKRHLCDQLTISDEILRAVIYNLYDARFRSMSADIMGNTYEQYLGKTLVVQNGAVVSADNLETRKAQGSYYTPEYIVAYIVDQTLGRYLYGTDDGRPDGKPQGKRKRLSDIDGSNGHPPLTVLDPASGSGSFLIRAYHVLEQFYESELVLFKAEWEAEAQRLAGEGVEGFLIRIELAHYEATFKKLRNYRNLILERHIYGVDLDPQAAELAAVNLMLRAITKGERLPLILNQNIKTGNSLIAAVPLDVEQARPLLAPHSDALATLRRLRLAQQGVIDDARSPFTLQQEIERLAETLDTALMPQLEPHFGTETATQRPFNWQVEFPELFVDEAGQLLEHGGFQFVIGNPPYLSVDDTWGENSRRAAYIAEAFSDVWAGKSDLYYYFMRQNSALLRQHGTLGVITARYFLEAHYASKLREALLQAGHILQIVDFGDYVVFPKVGTKTSITIIEKCAPDETHHLTFLRANSKWIAIEPFLATPLATRKTFPQARLDANSWILVGETVATLLAKIDADTIPLGDICFIGQGMQTGRNKVFVLSEQQLAEHKIEKSVVRRVLKNQDILRYAAEFRDLYLIYPEAIDELDDYPNTKRYLEAQRQTLEERAAFKRGDCEWWRFTWPLHKERYDLQKLMVPYIAATNRFMYDADAEYIGLTDTTALFPTQETPDLRYLLALLNSRLLTFRYQRIAKPKDYRYEYFENGLAKVPIKQADAETQTQLITMAQAILDRYTLISIVEQTFDESLEAELHTLQSLYSAYIQHSEYRYDHVVRVGRVDANAKGVVTAVRVVEAGETLTLFATLTESAEQPLLTVQIQNVALRRFLHLSLRRFLAQNRRKRIWSRGTLLKGVLSALKVPVFNQATASANIAAIEAFMRDVERRIGVEQTHFPDPLALSQIEATIAETDANIDQLVYALYGLDADDIAIVEAT